MKNARSIFNFNKNTLVLFLLIVLTVFAGCSKTIYSTGWQATPVKADGSLSDWEIPLRYYDDATKLSYSITNDAHNLYLCIRAADEQTQMKMLRAGFTVWLDVTGKKNKTVSIAYPLAHAMEMGHEHNGSGQGMRGNREGMKKEALNEQTQMQLTGFAHARNGMVLLHTDEGINVAVKYDSTDEVVYEASIPFKTFYKETITAADTLKPWSVALEVNGIESPSGGGHSGGGGMRGGSMRGGGGGMRGGSGMRGGGGGEEANRSSLAETKTIWNNLRLSLK